MGERIPPKAPTCVMRASILSARGSLLACFSGCVVATGTLLLAAISRCEREGARLSWWA